MNKAEMASRGEPVDYCAECRCPRCQNVRYDKYKRGLIGELTWIVSEAYALGINSAPALAAYLYREGIRVTAMRQENATVPRPLPHPRPLDTDHTI